MREKNRTIKPRIAERKENCVGCCKPIIRGDRLDEYWVNGVREPYHPDCLDVKLLQRSYLRDFVSARYRGWEGHRTI